MNLSYILFPYIHIVITVELPQDVLKCYHINNPTCWIAASDAHYNINIT